MIKAELDEAISGMNTVIAALLGTLQGQTGLPGATLRQLCGNLSDNGAAELDAGGPAFWVGLAASFEAAYQAGATYRTMDAVRAAAEALTPNGRAAIAVKNFSTRMALAELARILAATTFVSRQDIDKYFDQIDAAFRRAELVAADNLDNVAYCALLAIHAAVSNDLSTRSRPLPRMVSYSFPARLPALTLAMRLYADPTRSDELIGENKPTHPLFMPPSGKALSS